ncbi:MAG: PspC domain-containing protein [Rikenellaceae bacterium]
MKVTKNVNIAGSAYIIDEDAYKHLSSYLSDISSRFDNEDERTEVLNDIESRISEILRENGIDGYRVVGLELIRRAISIIGSPDIFGTKKSYPRDGSYTPITERRKLFRDPADKVIGGVCSGLAAYFVLDTVLVRLIIFLLTFIGGVSILLYIVAWIVIPIAHKPEDLALLEEMKQQR